MTLSVYRPAPADENLVLEGARRLRSLSGMKVGFIGNLKPNCDVLLHTTEELMKDRLGVAETFYREKSSCSVGAPTEMLDELAAVADAAVVALGD
jgi:hypothetical protein